MQESSEVLVVMCDNDLLHTLYIQTVSHKKTKDNIQAWDLVKL